MKDLFSNKVGIVGCLAGLVSLLCSIVGVISFPEEGCWVAFWIGILSCIIALISAIIGFFKKPKWVAGIALVLSLVSPLICFCAYWNMEGKIAEANGQSRQEVRETLNSYERVEISDSIH